MRLPTVNTRQANGHVCTYKWKRVLSICWIQVSTAFCAQMAFRADGNYNTKLRTPIQIDPQTEAYSCDTRVSIPFRQQSYHNCTDRNTRSSWQSICCQWREKSWPVTLMVCGVVMARGCCRTQGTLYKRMVRLNWKTRTQQRMTVIGCGVR
jgi:hypothetical protein